MDSLHMIPPCMYVLIANANKLTSCRPGHSRTRDVAALTNQPAGRACGRPDPNLGNLLPRRLSKRLRRLCELIGGLRPGCPYVPCLCWPVGGFAGWLAGCCRLSGSEYMTARGLPPPRLPPPPRSNRRSGRGRTSGSGTTFRTASATTGRTRCTRTTTTTTRSRCMLPAAVAHHQPQLLLSIEVASDCLFTDACLLLVTLVISTGCTSECERGAPDNQAGH
eukprot:SAG22_NODE_101_length_20519_cov_15.588002_11_plen_221_part_00